MRSRILAVMLMAAGVASAADLPRPEHPRPDAFRDSWMSLNGEWQFEIDDKADGEQRGLISGKDLGSKITVPFCPESKLSGLGIGNTQYLHHVWYRRTLEVPAAMQGKRLRLHFGAVDFQASIYINGQLAGTHSGGCASFSFDVAHLLKAGSNEVVVRVVDDLRSGNQGCGKQSYNQSEGCNYTRTTGIWQSVWLEAVGSTYIDTIAVTPDPDHNRVLVSAVLDGKDTDLNLTAEALINGKVVGHDRATGKGSPMNLVLDLSEKHLWEPGKPFLYDLKLTLTSGGKPIDAMQSYFGLRSLVIEGRRILINGKPVFQRLILDQGFYPDGIWTAPSDEALKNDIELSMAAGYNGARLHQKVFEPRFHYWADKLGYMTWGEYPSWGYNYKRPGMADYLSDWTEVMLRDRNHPSIVGWCPFNESTDSAAEVQQMIFRQTKAIDPSRPAIESSGYVQTLPHPEVLDAHDYNSDPVSFHKRWMNYFSGVDSGSLPSRFNSDKDPPSDRGIPFMVSEFGGIGWATEGGWGYSDGPKTVEEFYTRYDGLCKALLDNPNMFGFCYTQLTDVEQERNGLYFYNRKAKFDLKRIHDATARQAACERNEPMAPQPQTTVSSEWTVLVGSSKDGALNQPYRYVVGKPAEGWNTIGFDDKSWQTGLAPFGRTEQIKIATPWTTNDIFLRRTFDYQGEFKLGAVVIAYDDDSEVYVNGEMILGVTGYKNYEIHAVTAALRKALKPGTNTLAIHTHQGTGDQMIDLALMVTR